MDRERQHAHLVHAEEIAVHAREHVEQQRALTDRLRREGHGTRSAEALLRALERSAKAMEHHRNILLDVLTLNEADQKRTGAMRQALQR